MLSAEQIKVLQEFAKSLDERQRWWASGYLAGMDSSAPLGAAEPAGAAATTAASTLTVLYGSQTGRSKAAAEDLATAARECGHAVRVVSMLDYKPAMLKKETHLAVVVSTHGEGDPPDEALQFFSFLLGARAPKDLGSLRYSVLALGDSSYEYFCKAGRDIDARLEELGATRMADRIDCDLEFTDELKKWTGEIVSAVVLPSNASPIYAVPGRESASAYTRENPFEAEVLANIPLLEAAAGRDTRHVELSLEGSGLSFEPGDSLGIFPENPPDLVERVMKLLAAADGDEVGIGSVTAPLGEWLTRRLEIARLTPPALVAYAEVADSARLREIAADHAVAREYLSGVDFADILEEFPPHGEISAVLKPLRKIAPRLYSIASSLSAREDEVHVLVGDASYATRGGLRAGLCSGYIARRPAGSSVRVHVQPNDRFRLPADDVPVIMIGPGTGVAPFRSFLEEREFRGASGLSWLFFGERRFATDFYYQAEWLNMLKNGVLSRLDVAFSRDGPAKVYVQDKMRKHADELLKWIDDGACVYVCGDEKRMAADVEAAIIEILSAGSGNPEQRLDEMRRTGRYQRDVY